jgi:hypothetical protein
MADCRQTAPFPADFATSNAAAFTHHGHTVSQGVDGQTGTRNTPPIQEPRVPAHFYV